MSENERIIQLLQEIRDDQRNWINESRETAQHAVEVHNEALRRQKKVIRLCWQVAGTGGVVIVAALVYLVGLLSWG